MTPTCEYCGCWIATTAETVGTPPGPVRHLPCECRWRGEQIERLTRECDEAIVKYGLQAEEAERKWKRAIAQIERLRAERDALHDGLERLHAGLGLTDHGDDVVAVALQRIAQLRAELERRP